MIYPKITIDDMAHYCADMYNVSGSEIPQEEYAYARILYVFSRELPGMIKNKTGMECQSFQEAKNMVEGFLNYKIREFCDRYIAPVIYEGKLTDIPAHELDFCNKFFAGSFITHCLNVNGYKLNNSFNLKDIDKYAYERGDNYCINPEVLVRTEKNFNYEEIKKKLLKYEGKFGPGFYGKENIHQSFIGKELKNELMSQDALRREADELRKKRQLEQECLTVDELIEELEEASTKIKGHNGLQDTWLKARNTKRRWESMKTYSGLTYETAKDFESGVKKQLEDIESKIENLSRKNDAKNLDSDYSVDVGKLAESSIELFEDISLFTKSIDGEVSKEAISQLVSEVNQLIGQCNHTVSAFGRYLRNEKYSNYKVAELDPNEVSKETKTIEFEEHLKRIESKVQKMEESFKKGNSEVLNYISDKLQNIKAVLKQMQTEKENRVNAEKNKKAASEQKDEGLNNQDLETNAESFVSETNNSVVQTENNVNPVKEQTLRQKFDINNEEGFDKLLAHYAKINKDYYSSTGKKSEEDVKRRRNINSQMKRILNKKALSMPQNENGEDFASTIKSIETGNVFSYSELKLVAENKTATIMLFNIMASGVYEKGGEKIRLTPKQRVALASTLEIVSGMRLDMDKSKKAEFGGVVLTTENAKYVEA